MTAAFQPAQTSSRPNVAQTAIRRRLRYTHRAEIVSAISGDFNQLGVNRPMKKRPNHPQRAAFVECYTENLVADGPMTGSEKRSVHMIRMNVALVLAVVTCLGVHAAEWDHIHLTTPDTKAAAEWYAKHFGGTVTKSGPFDAVLFDGKLVKFREGEARGTRGCAVDHFAFAVKDLEAKMEELRDAGVRVGHRTPRGVGSAILTDPWGTRVELIQRDDYEGFDHVHLFADDPDETLAWYAAAFGGEVENYQGIEHIKGVKYGDIWILAQRGKVTPRGTKGRSIDHLGWTMDDFEGTVERLKAVDTPFPVEPRESEGHMMAFIESPQGVKIELVGKPKK